MANINVNLGSSNTTGVNTSNPQSGGQDTSLIGQPQNPQDSNSTSSINNQSTGVPITLEPTTELKTAAITTSQPKPTHNISTAGVAIVGVLVILAIAVSFYIYLSDKKAVKNT